MVHEIQEIRDPSEFPEIQTEFREIRTEFREIRTEFRFQVTPRTGFRFLRYRTTKIYDVIGHVQVYLSFM